MEDEQIQALYFQRDETAIELTRAKYGRYCASVAGRILDDSQDVEEILNDTWLRAWTSIPPQRPACLKLYVARIARNLAFDRFRSQNREKRGGDALTLALEELSYCIPAGGTPGDALDAQELRNTVSAFLAKLPRRYHMRETNVQAILSRIRKKLKAYLVKEVFSDERIRPLCRHRRRGRRTAA